jgi:large subunit ribosomal protein L6
MSKIGKKSIALPKESSVKIEGSMLTVTGPKGSQQLSINDKMFSSSVNEKNELQILPLNKKNMDKKTSVLWGTYRSLLNNAVLGVSSGHEKILDITGVGFRANLKGEILNLQLGFSHDINYKISKDVKIVVEKQTVLKISGINKETVSKIASEIKAFKPVEPYKGKGITERGQFILRKEGKKK